MLPLWRSGTSADAADMSLCYAEVGKGYLSFGVSGAVVDTSKGTRPVYLGAPPVLRKAPLHCVYVGGIGRRRAAGHLSTRRWARRLGL